MKKLHILMVNKYYPPHLGGIEFHLEDLAKGLVATGKVNVTVLVVGDTKQLVEECIDGVKIVRLPLAFEYASTPVSWSFRKKLKQLSLEADVVHFHFPYPYGEFCSLFTKIKVPVVVTYHSDIVRQKTLLALYRPFLNRFLNRADCIVASSPNMIEHSEFLNCRKSKVTHVNFGLPLQRLLPTEESDFEAAEIRKQLKSKNDSAPIMLLFVGRLVYYKGVSVLIDAMKDVDLRASLYIVGTGPLEAELRAQAIREGVEDRIVFLPSQPFSTLHALYSAADVFVLPSVERSEAFGLVQIEAHATKTPVVSTNLTTGVPYANLDNVTGRVVEVGDPVALAKGINELVLNDEFRNTCAKEAHHRAFTEFTVPLMCENMLTVYREVTEKYRKGIDKK